MPNIHRLALVGLLMACVTPVEAANLRPHRAVYDLSLVEQTDEMNSVEGRIALEMQADGCQAYDLDFRFVARFHQSDEITVTDQQTLSRETRDGTTFVFDTKTLVDGIEQEAVKGTAVTQDAGTMVNFTKPTTRDLDLPRSSFPLQHTSQLIDKARKGERIIETRLFDGDDEAEKHLTTTALIQPAPNAGGREQLAGLQAWKVVESYFNSDSDADGMPIFQTRYVLYENGVSDDLYMNFGSYALRGKIGQLDYLGGEDCGASPAAN